MVWASTGQLFPLNALSVIEARDVDVALRVDRSTAFLLAIAIAGWGIVAWRALRRRAAPASSLVAAIGLAPAALYAASLGLNARNFAGLAVLSAVAVGAGGAWLVASLRQREPHAVRPHGARLATIALVGVAVLALAAPVVGQRDAGRVAPDRIGDELAAWLAANAPDGGRIVMAFREREQMALRLYGQATWRSCRSARVDAVRAPEDLPVDGPPRPSALRLPAGRLDRDARPAGDRSARRPARARRAPPVHPVRVDRDDPGPAQPGPHPGHHPEADGDRAEIYRRDPGAAASATATSRSTCRPRPPRPGSTSPAATPQRSPARCATGRRRRPDAIAALTERLGETACATPPEGSIALGPAGNLPGLTRTARLGTSVAILHRTDGRRRLPRPGATVSMCRLPSSSA